MTTIISIYAIVFLAYFFICFLVASYAKKKGRSFLVFFLLSMFLTPFWGFIIALVVPNERKAQQQHEELVKAMANNSMNQ
ncbi:hypothetical protein PGH07_03730 [Sulfurovum sp. zt1-1]|uniref:Cardiolipin synthase N-terminal domain-containing protein n=1 Tax=Sulfurovum zhangzhouensis TaxID=3019067 RepID=A0ABT7QWR0_9BACT|nr:hypothetical protein [Sulfurovum zhangzhouensis]MDM5271278.1 hypothetical protein [Sulfurovum zhangzhouensis]